MTHPLVSGAVVSALLAATVVTISAQQPPAAAASPAQQVDVTRLGPQVGERVPDFSLTDQNGRAQTLKTLMGPSGAMLVFFRSADW
jgi:cytochrome oxidase Cu insertion factor (SCO1/SenC/PrrC family)